MERVLRLFVQQPTRYHYFRQIVRDTGVSPNLAQRYLRHLLDEGLITTQHLDRTFYRANRENERFIQKKRLMNLTSLFDSGIVSYLDDTFSPGAIVLFGSFNSGYDTEESDIDLYLQCEHLSKTVPADIKGFDLHRPVSIHTMAFTSLSPEFRNAIVNGTVLSGYFDGHFQGDTRSGTGTVPHGGGKGTPSGAARDTPFYQ